MVRKNSERVVVSMCVRGGHGECEMHKILNSPEELYGKGTLFNHVIIRPGDSIGDHLHTGNNEIYYVLSGTGDYNDNGTQVKISAGDVTVCNDGESHGVVNNSTEPLEMIALILNS